MKRILFICLLILFTHEVAMASNTLPSHESFYRESANTQTTIKQELKQSNIPQAQNKKENNSQNKRKTKNLTNYQYDENNYHYYKIQNYIQNNIDYSNSGRLKY